MGGEPSSPRSAPSRRSTPRDRLLIWLLGEGTFRHSGKLEQTLIVWIFFILGLNVIFATGNMCLSSGACAEERTRRAAAVEEAAKIRIALTQVKSTHGFTKLIDNTKTRPVTTQLPLDLHGHG